MTGEHLKHACIALVNHKISAGHAMILLLAEEQPVSMTDIANAGGFSTSNSTGLVDSLCSEGLVSREHPPGDRRKVMARITQRGTDVLQSLKKQLAPL
jgi:DNA-binding MarR family transcriptional regulator